LTRAVAVLNVDAFALINQTYGPDAGDDVLVEVGRRLTAVAGTALVGRWQADEFVCVLDADDPVAAIDALSVAILQAVRVPLTIADHHVHLTISAGLATAALARDGDLLGAATDALHVAKATGRDRAVWFNAALRPTPRGGMRLANDLHRGIERGELRLHYQPIVELTDNHPVGVEALVRWEHPCEGLLEPAGFIDLAERTGQIVPLGVWVTQQACFTAVRLAALGSGPHPVSINLSALQLSDRSVVDMVQAALDESACPPSYLEIEVTESALMADLAAATATLEAIKALGVSLALDDFGTGFSSLLYLKHFPVDRIKIDKSFVRGLGADADDTAIVASTVSLAHQVGVKCVAEGVETVDQLALLREMGCDFAQGYLFSRALTYEQLQEWLPRHQPGEPATVRLPADVPEMRRILRLHGEGASLHTIAGALNQDGRRTARGSRWTAPSVARVITRSQFPTLRLPR
jgi:diguanylate cyclase (GGDEF)-like protein